MNFWQDICCWKFKWYTWTKTSWSSIPLHSGLPSFCPVIIPILKAPSGESGSTKLYSGVSINEMGRATVCCHSMLRILNPQFFPWPIKSIALTAFTSEVHFVGSLGTFISMSNPQFSTLPSGIKGQPNGTVNLTSIWPRGSSLLILTFVDLTCDWKMFHLYNQ